MRSPTVPALRWPHRSTGIALGVVALHVALLAALQSGLLRRAVERVVPVQPMAVLAPEASPPHPVPPKAAVVPPAAPQPRQSVPAPQAVVAAAPMPQAAVEAAPSPTASTGVATQPIAPPLLAPQAAVPAPTPAKVELPSTQAEYLHNPKPAYPLLSKRAGEQGAVLVRVLIGTDGLPQKAELKASSGFDRLDRAALATVLQWRYVPGKRGGVPEAMWFNVPINFVLE